MVLLPGNTIIATSLYFIIIKLLKVVLYTVINMTSYIAIPKVKISKKVLVEWILVRKLNILNTINLRIPLQFY